jgi:predicted homoserine dehydrogenase-like protein
LASLENRYLPLGLAHNVKLVRDIDEGQRLRWSDIEIDQTDLAVRTRRELEESFRRPKGGDGTAPVWSDSGALSG